MSFLDSNVEEEEWPKRLLHVKSMTSYPRKKGINYNGDHRPLYNILSYTWGRYEDRRPRPSKRRPQITIKGGNWEIPTMDTTSQTNGHGRITKPFSADEFEAVINVIGQGVEFVWVDVACINQNDNSPEKKQEIGNQANIFKRASKTFVWLWSLDDAALLKFNNYCNVFHHYFDYPFQDRSIEQPFAQNFNAALLEFFGDNWFSSLWTLQEACLRDDAYLISRTGGNGIPDRSLLQMETDLFGYVRLQDVAFLIQDWEEESNQPRGINLRNDTVDAAIQSSGLKQLAPDAFNYLFVLNVTRFRKTRNEVDRVYAIQQIYNFRLGNTKPGYEDTNPNLNALLAEFAINLLERSPILSNLFVHLHMSLPILNADRWRFGPSSYIPPNVAVLYEIVDQRIQGLSHTVSGTVFQGPVYPLQNLLSAWENSSRFSIEEHSRSSLSHNPRMRTEKGSFGIPLHYSIGAYGFQLIVLDEGPWIQALGLPHRTSDTIVLDRALHIGRKLCSRQFSDQNWTILILGKVAQVGHPFEERNDCFAGILVFQVTDIGWRRAGFCIWAEEDMIDGMDEVIRQRHSKYLLI